MFVVNIVENDLSEVKEKTKKLVIIVAYLIEEAIEGKSNSDLESEILADLEDRSIAYTSKIEKVTVLDCPG